MEVVMVAVVTVVEDMGEFFSNTCLLCCVVCCVSVRIDAQ